MDSKAQRSENKFLNTLKGAACLLVVCIHCRFPGAFGELVLAQARVAVPFFFVVSGIFLSGGAHASQAHPADGACLDRLHVVFFSVAGTARAVHCTASQ